VAPTGRSNALTFRIHAADRLFTLANLRVGPAVNAPAGSTPASTIPFSVDIDDPTGSVCQSPLNYVYAIGGPPFGQIILGSARADALPCASPGRATLQQTIRHSGAFTGGIDIPFELYLTNSLDIESNRIRGTFRAQ
jgi:hypothetical protein